MKYSFSVPGEPRPLKRARHFRRGNHVGTYDPPENVAAKHDIQCAGMKHKPARPLDGAIRLTLLFIRKFPKSMSARKRDFASPTTRPDIDNYIKLVMDALNGLFWLDDSQVVDIHAAKVYGDAPSAEIMIEEVYKNKGEPIA